MITGKGGRRRELKNQTKLSFHADHIFHPKLFSFLFLNKWKKGLFTCHWLQIGRCDVPAPEMGPSLPAFLVSHLSSFLCYFKKECNNFQTLLLHRTTKKQQARVEEDYWSKGKIDISNHVGKVLLLLVRCRAPDQIRREQQKKIDLFATGPCNLLINAA